MNFAMQTGAGAARGGPPDALHRRRLRPRLARVRRRLPGRLSHTRARAGPGARSQTYADTPAARARALCSLR